MTDLQHALPFQLHTLVQAQLDQVSLQRRQVRRVSTVRCAATSAGVGRFVYLQGRSGRRYVFCSITAEQGALYGNGIFAARCGEAGEVEVGFSAHQVAGKGGLFVHLPDDNSADGARAVMEDL
ncbi:MAG: hypothetical protein AAF764_04540 [Pseudomonadota bacterium]